MTQSSRISAQTGKIASKIRVLVVDDDEDAANGVAELLEAEGHTVAITHDGTNALRSAVMMVPDMALVDLRLGQEWGLDVIEALKGQFPDLVCIVMTGESDSSTVIRAMRHGVHDYLTKPFDPEHLISIIDRASERVRLQDERRQILDELATARDKAELASRSKTEFLTRLSGELGEQFSSVVRLSNVIADRGAEQTAQAAAATGIADGCRRLSRIMMWIGELGQLEAGTMPIERTEFSLADVSERLLKIFDNQVAEKHIEASLKIAPDLPPIVSDGDHFARILGHLLSNAVKFTGNGGKIEVTALVDGFGDLRLDVRDSGIGMSSDDIQLALTPFGRLHSTTGTDPYGVGLGLPLASKFARLLGGSFHIESTLGTGTSVSMKFGKDAVFRPEHTRLSA